MLAQLLLPPIPDLHLTTLETTAETIIVTLTATAATACCPRCSVAATRIHNTYSRTPTDLPWAGARLRLVLTVRRWFCDNPACRRKIFCERLGPALRVYARCTTRLAAQLQRLGLRGGSKPAAALGTELGLPTSPTTLLRLMRQAVLPAHSTPRVLGLDDFAFRKGQTYGTILIDWERHCPVDLLPDRDAETIAAWLHEHPGVEIFSRDRASAYAEAATDGASEALQVADRFDLVQNLGDAVQRLLHRFPGALQQVTEQLAAHTAQALLPPPAPPPQSRRLAGRMRPRQRAHPRTAGSPPPALPHRQPPVTPGAARTQQRFAQVKDLQAQGLSQRAIARRLGWNRRTVRRYMVADQAPVRGLGPQAQSRASAYGPYLRRRWAEGVRHRVQLWQELVAQGYQGSYASMYRFLIRLFGLGRTARVARSQGSPAPAPPQRASSGPEEVRPLTARQARWLLL